MRASVWPAVTTTLVLWASAFIAIRIALPTMGFLGLSVGRLLIASLAVLAVRRFFAVPMPERGDFVRIGLCGLTGMAAYQLLLNAGELTVEAGVASLLVNTGPIFAAILARLLLGEALNGYVKTGIAIGFAGACLVALAGDSGLALSPGALLVLGAALSQALYFVLSKPLSARYGGFAIACYAIWSGTVLSLPLLPWLVLRAPQASPAAIGALVFLGVGPSAVGFVSWAYAQARMDIAAATNLLYLVPFIAGGIGWVVLGERPALLAVIGGLIALLGVAVSRRRPPVRARSGPAGADSAAGPSGVRCRTGGG